MDFVRFPPLMPSFPSQTACLHHLQTFYIPSVVLLNPMRSNPYPSSQFLIFITPKLLNSPPLCLSASPAFSSITLLSFIQYFPLIPSHSPSPPLSPSHLYPSITDLSSASSTHSQTLFFLPPIFTCYPLALLSSHPISFHSSFHSHRAPSSVAPFISSYPFRFSSPAGFFTPVCSPLPTSLPFAPIADSGGCAVPDYSSRSVTKLSSSLSLMVLLQPCSTAGAGT